MSAELDRLRADIERIDRTIIALLSQRVAVARAVGVAKKAEGLPTLDPAREAAVVRRAVEFARAARLEENEIRAVFWRIIGLSRRAQMTAE